MAKKLKAFTLLELLICLIVLGLLAALAIPSYTRVQKNSTYNTASTMSKSIARSANSIANIGGRNTTSTDISTATNEVTVPSGTTVTYSGGSTTVVTGNGGNNAQTCYVYINGSSASTVGLATNSPGTTAC